MGWRRKQPRSRDPYAKELADTKYRQRRIDNKKASPVKAWRKEVQEELEDD